MTATAPDAVSQICSWSAFSAILFPSARNAAWRSDGCESMPVTRSPVARFHTAAPLSVRPTIHRPSGENEAREGRCICLPKSFTAPPGVPSQTRIVGSLPTVIRRFPSADQTPA